VDRRGCPHPVEGVGPAELVLEVDCVVVAVGEAEPQQDAARGFDAQRLDEFLPQQAHRGGAQDDDPLLAEPDQALARAEIEDLVEQALTGRCRDHTTLPTGLAPALKIAL